MEIEEIYMGPELAKRIDLIKENNWYKTQNIKIKLSQLNRLKEMHGYSLHIFQQRPMNQEITHFILYYLIPSAAFRKVVYEATNQETTPEQCIIDECVHGFFRELQSGINLSYLTVIARRLIRHYKEILIAEYFTSLYLKVSSELKGKRNTSDIFLFGRIALNMAVAESILNEYSVVEFESSTLILSPNSSIQSVWT